MRWVQLGDELDRVKQEIEERGNTMSDGGKNIFLLIRPTSAKDVR